MEAPQWWMVKVQSIKVIGFEVYGSKAIHTIKKLTVKKKSSVS